MGFRFLNLLVWDKQSFGGGYHWRNQAEYIVYVSKGKPACYVKGSSNVFNYKRPLKADAKPSIGYDPCTTSSKPLEIWRDILVNGGRDGDVVADPFAGSNPMRAAIMFNSNLLSKVKTAYCNQYFV